MASRRLSGARNDNGRTVLKKLSPLRCNADDGTKTFTAVDVSLGNEVIDDADDRADGIIGENPVGSEAFETLYGCLIRTREDLGHLLPSDLLACPENA